MLDGAALGGAAGAPAASPGPSRGCEALELLRAESGDSPAISAVMFSAGLLGNLTALGLLVVAARRRRRRRGAGRGAPPGPFHVLLLALVLTDLLGTCLLSPVVLAAYGRGRTLVALAEGGRVCLAFAFAMSFFGLTTVGCLGSMALERSLALGAPYLYERLLRGRRAAAFLGVALAALYALAAAFCALPLLGFGRYVQYCPGTWCFIQMRLPAGRDEADAPSGTLAFSVLYASLLLLLILAVLLGNLSVIVNLVRMHRRGKATRRLAACPAPSSPPLGPPPEVSPDGPPPSARRRPLSVSEELDHLILLSIMTLTFAVCSLPFTIRAFMNYFMPGGDSKGDLLAMRFLSINSIIDPWVFVILRPSVLQLLRSIFSCRRPFSTRARKGQRPPPLAKPMPIQQADIGRE